MKSFLILVLAFFMSISVFAAGNSENKFGLGLAMDHDFFSELFSRSGSIEYGLPEKLVFSMTEDNLKFELQGMLINGHKSYDNGDYSSSSSITMGDMSLGVYMVDSLNNNFNLYYGAKIGMVFSMGSSEKSYPGESNSDSDEDISLVYINPTLGGEYFFIPNFSVSLELALKVTIMNDDSSDRSEYYLSTLSSLLVKFYF